MSMKPAPLSKRRNFASKLRSLLEVKADCKPVFDWHVEKSTYRVEIWMEASTPLWLVARASSVSLDNGLWVTDTRTCRPACEPQQRLSQFWAMSRTASWSTGTWTWRLNWLNMVQSSNDRYFLHRQRRQNRRKKGMGGVGWGQELISVRVSAF